MRRPIVSLDYETHLIAPGLLAPPLVCGSTAGEKTPAEILDAARALAVTRELLEGDDIIAGANIAYDFGVAAAAEPALLPPIFKAYADGRVYDIQIAQFLDSIAKGHVRKEGIWDPTTHGYLCDASGKKTNRYSLDTCVRLNLGRTDAKKNDFWRLRYGILAPLSIALWPEPAVQYPKDDARNTVDVAVRQIDGAPGIEPLENLHNMREQAEAAFALHLGAMHGLRADVTRYHALSARVDALHAEYVKRFQAHGFIRADGTEDGSAVKRAVATAYGATGVCGRCKGTGRHRPPKVTPCRGPKVKNRYAGCQGAACACGGSGTVTAPGNEVICRVTDDGVGCDGTGLDLNTASVLPRADKGGVKTDRDTLGESGDENLMAYGENEAEKIKSTYLPFLAGGLTTPINLRPNVLVASGRTSYDMIQQFPRVSALGSHGCAGPACEWCGGGGVVGKDKPKPCPGPPIWGPRACIVARPGHVFCSVDYSAIELCTLAQVCLYTVGGSRMADTINATKDPGSLHTAFAAQMIGLPVDEMIRRVKSGDKKAKDYRQAAKCSNFGFPGGMGPAKLVLAKRKRNEGITTGPDGRVYAGIRFCILLGGARECGTTKITSWKGRECAPVCKACVEIVAHSLRPAWFAAWPEMNEYFAWVDYQVKNYGRVPCFGPKGPDGQPKIERYRGGVDFCNGANNGFQALASDGGKRALRALTREAYLDESSPLFGTRFPMFIHDETFAEMPEEMAHLAGPRMAEIMVREMRVYTPDVWVAAEPALMRYWYKEAEPRYTDAGRLIPWEPKP